MGNNRKVYDHSVYLDIEKCTGCTNCIKHCPTEAIRVKKGRAEIIAGRCIDCGECIRVCPARAKKASSDPLSVIEECEFKVAIPAPSLYGQFKESISINKILTGLKYLGFDDVFEVAEAAEVATQRTVELLEKGDIPNPVISSSCPVVVRLIQSRFPGLIKHLLPLISPMEIAADMVREKYKDKKNLGVYFISPCAAKMTAIKNPLSVEKSGVTGVIGIKDIYLLMRSVLKKIDVDENLHKASNVGIAWARTEGESSATELRKTISVDGIQHVIAVLENLENGKMANIDFIEMMSCPGGCVGGPLCVENPYIARTRVKNRELKLIDEMEQQGRKPASGKKTASEKKYPTKDFGWEKGLDPTPIYLLDKDPAKAMAMMEKIAEIEERLPGLDCGSCGAPTCKSLAEDIVRNKAVENDCLFILRTKLHQLTKEMLQLESIVPPGLDKQEK